MLGAEEDCDLWKNISRIALDKQRNYDDLQKSDKELVEFVKEQIYRDFCGKRTKKSKKAKDFKVRNTEELSRLISIKEDDSNLTKLKKDCFRELFNFFFNSNLYAEWLEKGMINSVNKSFFIVNKKELHKKFQNPLYYKPRFIHDIPQDHSQNLDPIM